MSPFGYLLIIGVVTALILYTLGWLGERYYKLKEQLDDLEKFLESPEGIVHVLSGQLTKSTADAACWDIHSGVDITALPGQQVMVASGLVTEMFGCDAFMFSKSGLTLKYRLTHRAGVIDEKYPKEWTVLLVNEGREPYTIRVGDKVGQCLFVPKFKIDVLEKGGKVINRSDVVRTDGFGSTGR